MCKTKRRDFFFWHWGLNSGPHTCQEGALTAWVTLPASFCVGHFWDRVSRTVCPGLASNHTILLISASWVTRITGATHQCSARRHFVFQRNKEFCRIHIKLESLSFFIWQFSGPHHLNHIPKPFLLTAFVLHFYAWAGLDYDHSICTSCMAGLTGAALHSVCFTDLRWGLVNFLPGLPWNCNPPDLCLPGS
jgi:hypothetical protein